MTLISELEVTVLLKKSRPQTLVAERLRSSGAQGRERPGYVAGASTGHKVQALKVGREKSGIEAVPGADSIHRFDPQARDIDGATGLLHAAAVATTLDDQRAHFLCK